MAFVHNLHSDTHGNVSSSGLEEGGDSYKYSLRVSQAQTEEGYFGIVILLTYIW